MGQHSQATSRSSSGVHSEEGAAGWSHRPRDSGQEGRSEACEGGRSAIPLLRCFSEQQLGTGTYSGGCVRGEVDPWSGGRALHRVGDARLEWAALSCWGLDRVGVRNQCGTPPQGVESRRSLCSLGVPCAVVLNIQLSLPAHLKIWIYVCMTICIDIYRHICVYARMRKHDLVYMYIDIYIIYICLYLYKHV